MNKNIFTSSKWETFEHMRTGSSLIVQPLSQQNSPTFSQTYNTQNPKKIEDLLPSHKSTLIQRHSS